MADEENEMTKQITDGAGPLKGNELIAHILDILMKDYDAIRSEIRASESRHEKVSLWLSSGLLAATAACFKDFEIGFAFIPLVILAYYAHRLYSHSLHTATLSQWVMRIEDLVDKVLSVQGLLEWERTFVRQRLKSFSLSSAVSPHYVVELFLLLPSLVVFVIAVYFGPPPASEKLGISLNLAKWVIWSGYPLLLVVLFAVFLLIRPKTLENARKDSVDKTFASIERALGKASKE